MTEQSTYREDLLSRALPFELDEPEAVSPEELLDAKIQHAFSAVLEFTPEVIDDAWSVAKSAVGWEETDEFQIELDRQIEEPGSKLNRKRLLQAMVEAVAASKLDDDTAIQIMGCLGSSCKSQQIDRNHPKFKDLMIDSLIGGYTDYPERDNGFFIRAAEALADGKSFVLNSATRWTETRASRLGGLSLLAGSAPTVRDYDY